MSQPVPDPTTRPATPAPDLHLIPRPVSVETGDGSFALSPATAILVWPPSAEVRAIATYLSDALRAATGYEMRIQDATGPSAPGNILLTTAGAGAELGEEGYTLTVTAEQVTATANEPAGLFYAGQTLQQLLPPGVAPAAEQAGPAAIPALSIVDYPRYSWRGAMLDVARHFFGVEDVKRYIDLMALYKLNRLHLHLTDDQGWRILIASWPRLALYGGSSATGGDPGGFYTREEYAAIVTYAQSRYITVVPEIEMPGHSNAALASYPELNCDGRPQPLYTGIEVGFSSLCIEKEGTYRFVDDVIREVAALTPGPYIHVGGDEAHSTPREAYVTFMHRVQEIVQSHGKQMIGWGEILGIELASTSVVQFWDTNPAAVTRAREALAGHDRLQVIMSPGARTYLDMQYDAATPLGLHWAGYIEVRDAYEWDPATLVPELGEDAILGVEAPLWTETLRTMAELEYMAFPRLLGIAEVGWSPASARNWDEYRARLGAHGPRLQTLGVNFYRSPQVTWR